jgi:tRNA U34 5-methylaminomethyl-2-thiouridine-forming methyltransferase MnmC
LNQHYHSTFGAVQESQHIFIETGFRHFLENIYHGHDSAREGLNILEVGFGTGLNALLTQAEAEKNGIMVNYAAIESLPLDESCWRLLNYPQLFDSPEHAHVFGKMHIAPWNKPVKISPFFSLYKIHGDLGAYIPETGEFDLIYFDAFGPDAQPELWTHQVFRNLCSGLAPGGILVTYSVKGAVVRALRSSGFSVEKLPGPPGKRHILRAVKN